MRNMTTRRRFASDAAALLSSTRPKRVSSNRVVIRVANGLSHARLEQYSQPEEFIWTCGHKSRSWVRSCTWPKTTARGGGADLRGRRPTPPDPASTPRGRSSGRSIGLSMDFSGHKRRLLARPLEHCPATVSLSQTTQCFPHLLRRCTARPKRRCHVTRLQMQRPPIVENFEIVKDDVRHFESCFASLAVGWFGFYARP